MTGPGTSAPLTVGTAGHIDHGKTALIAALTGVDTDRLPEEKARGISIALGYAPLRLPSGRRVSVVDVPGHERFVRTMVAGATGVDLYLMVVAADDGVMPQTIEHATVLTALGVTDGVVAVTKADIADPGPAAEAARELMGGVEVVPCSARTGTGVPDVAAALDRIAARVASRAGGGGSSLAECGGSSLFDMGVRTALMQKAVHQTDQDACRPRKREESRRCDHEAEQAPVRGQI